MVTDNKALANTSAPKAPQEEKNVADWFSTGLRVAAWPVAALTGWAHARMYIGREFYENFKHQLSPERDARNSRIAELFPPPGVEKDIKDAVTPIQQDFWQTATGRFREAGYHNKWDMFKGLNQTQKWEAMVTFLTAAGVTLGVVMTIAENKTLRDLLLTKEEEEALRKADEAKNGKANLAARDTTGSETESRFAHAAASNPASPASFSRN